MIYLIYHAEYSDWNIYGYFTNEDDAVRYADILNKTTNKRDCEYQVMEVENYNVDAGKAIVHYEWSFHQDNEKITKYARQGYVGEKRKPEIRVSICYHYQSPYGDTFATVTAKTELHALKIYKSMMEMFKKYFKETGDIQQSNLLTNTNFEEEEK